MAQCYQDDVLEPEWTSNRFVGYRTLGRWRLIGWLLVQVIWEHKYVPHGNDKMTTQCLGSICTDIYSMYTVAIKILKISLDGMIHYYYKYV